MPRKSNKNLFRRGDTQQYKRIDISLNRVRAKKPSLTIKFNIPFYNIFIFTGVVAIFIIITPNLLYIHTIFNSTGAILYNFINSLIDLSFITIGFTLELNKHFISQNKILLTGLISQINSIRIQASNQIIYIIRLSIWPDLIKLYKEINLISLNYQLKSAQLSIYLLSFPDPRPGAIVIFSYIFTFTNYIFVLVVALVNLTNTLPVYKFTWDIEFKMLNYASNIAYTVSYLFISILITVISLIINFCIYIVTLLLNFLVNILNSIKEFFSSIYSVIREVAGFAYNLLKPIYVVVAANLRIMNEDMVKATENLWIFINSLANQFVKNRPN